MVSSKQMKKYDLIIIGAGSAGYIAAIEAGKLNKNVLVVEKNKIGGVCLNAGCVPTKVFYQFAKLFNNLKKYKEKNIFTYKVEFSLDNIIKYKNNVVLKLQKGVEFLFKKYKVDFKNGNASILIKNNKPVVLINDEQIEADRIVLATGSYTYIPEQWKDFAIAAEEFLNLNKFPDNITIIGAGVIGCELASIFSSLGIKINLFEIQNEILPFLDKDINQIILKALTKNNVTVSTNKNVSKITKENNKYRIYFDETDSILTDKIIVAIGRKPNTDFVKGMLNFDKDGFIITDKNFQTSLAGVYAIGDVINNANMFAHLASFQATKLIEHLFGNSKKIDKFFPPYGIFTTPQISGIGITEKEAIESGKEYEIIKYPMFGTTIGKITDLKEGFIKIIKEKESNKILGIHIISENAVEIINYISGVFNNFYTDNLLEVFRNTIYIHPSEGEILKEIFY